MFFILTFQTQGTSPVVDTGGNIEDSGRNLSNGVSEHIKNALHTIRHL